MPRVLAKPTRRKKAPARKSRVTGGTQRVPVGTQADPMSGFHLRLAILLGDSSHGEVSRRTGIHAESVRRYRSGFMPSSEFVAATCLAYGVKADWLLLGRGGQRPVKAR